MFVTLDIPANAREQHQDARAASKLKDLKRAKGTMIYCPKCDLGFSRDGYLEGHVTACKGVKVSNQDKLVHATAGVLRGGSNGIGQRATFMSADDRTVIERAVGLHEDVIGDFR